MNRELEVGDIWYELRMPNRQYIIIEVGNYEIAIKAISVFQMGEISSWTYSEDRAIWVGRLNDINWVCIQRVESSFNRAKVIKEDEY